MLLNQAPHNLDLWQWIFGMPKKVRAFCAAGKYHNIDVEDDVTIYGEYENGAAATFISTTGEAPGTNRLEISGDLGKLVLEDGKLKWWKLKVPEREFCFTSKEGFACPEMDYEEYSEEAPDGHSTVLENFAEARLLPTDARGLIPCQFQTPRICPHGRITGLKFPRTKSCLNAILRSFAGMKV